MGIYAADAPDVPLRTAATALRDQWIAHLYKELQRVTRLLSQVLNLEEEMSRRVASRAWTAGFCSGRDGRVDGAFRQRRAGRGRA